ncbi:hypothetical protein IM543_18395 [Massilia sp. UMI-21]|nr:hypothetical protein IM543_18395 [Massilia sp. UMI-21]
MTPYDDLGTIDIDAGRKPMHMTRMPAHGNRGTAWHGGQPCGHPTPACR